MEQISLSIHQADYLCLSFPNKSAHIQLPIPFYTKENFMKFLTTVLILLSFSQLSLAKNNLSEESNSRKPSNTNNARIGSPKSISCNAKLLRTTNPITKNMDINDLLDDSTEVILGKVKPSCAKYASDKSGGCEVIIETENFFFRYAHNTQNGNIEIQDKVTGQSSHNSWSNQYQLTKSGYLTIDGEITNTKGGIGGDAQAFQVEFNCHALPNDWE